VIRAAANAIRAIHRGDRDLATRLLDESRAALERADEAAAEHPDVTHGGFIQDAAKEYAEARLTEAAVTGQPFPGPDEIGVDDGSWLHGLAESVGELRRQCLDLIRGEDLAAAETHLETMDAILSVLATIDVPDGLTRGLRRAADSARSITERTRGDLTTALGQRRLREALDAHRGALGGD
jgi:translin